MTFTLGAHVHQTDPVGQAIEMGADIAQIMVGDPQKWGKPTVPDGAETLRARAEEAGVGLYVHSAYVINVASTNNRIRIPSRKLLQQTVDLAAEIGARGVIVHGGHVTADDDPAVGFDNWRKCIDGLTLPVPLLIENTAGGTNAMARHLDRLQLLWDAVQSADGAENVGFCLDTCHAHAGGNDLATIVDDVRDITGRIDLIHCNDSRDAFNSGADRHATLDEGQIGIEPLLEVIRAAQAPVVLETPMASIADDLALLRERLG